MIPFNRPYISGKELEYIRQAVEGGWISGGGEFTRRCEELLQNTIGAERVLLTTSCTHALEMAATLLDVGEGDEVIVPSFTFVSTANAFYLRGARIVFADIREDTLTMDAEDVRRRLTGRTRVIVPVHYGGVGCDMDKLLDLAGSRRVAVVEDNAHGLFARYRGRNLGTLGTFGTLSFHETKNLICGVGGALILNDTRYLERAEIVREKGTDRSRFFRGEIDKYTWVGAGSSYQPSDMLAAFLYAQLEAREQIMAMRRALWEGYRERLADWAAGRGVRLPFVPGHCEPSWHLFYLIMQSSEERDRFISHLKEKDIQSVFHYPPLHLSAVGRSLGGREGDCPVSERVSGRLVRLPFYNTLSEDDLDSICARILAFP